MKKYVLMLSVAIAGCNYDSGSASYSKTFGKAYQASCILNNISNLEGYQSTFNSKNNVEISKIGIKSNLKLKMADNKVSGYTLKTKSENSNDKEVHKEIEHAITHGC